MAKNILLTVDALHYAPEAAEMAKELCQDPDDKVTILHVHEFAVGRFGRFQVDCPEGEAERMVTGIRAELTEAGIDAEAEIRETHVGRIARTIIEAANQHDARIIVLGSTRSTDLPPIPFGSVSLKVLHLAKRPVVIVPRQSVTAVEQAAIGSRHGAAVPGHPVAGRCLVLTGHDRRSEVRHANAHRAAVRGCCGSRRSREVLALAATQVRD